MVEFKRNMVLSRVKFLLLLMLNLVLIESCFGIKCYECSSTQDSKADNCGTYQKFEGPKYLLVECNSDESHTPGTFCVKITRQGPRGFIWDGRWKQVIRRCASVAENGLTNVCNWGVDEMGVYWEECYCSTDSCNGT